MNAVRLILALFLEAFFVKNLDAVPAYPRYVPIEIAGKTVYIRLLGDEHQKYAESIDGYTILQKDDVWYYAEKDTDGYLVPSNYKLSATIGDGVRSFMDKTQPHLRSENIKNTYSSLSPSNMCHVNKNPVIGKRKMLIIMMQFPDLGFVKELCDFNALFNERGYNTDGAQGSVFDYYTDVSYGQLQLSCDVIGPFTCKYDRSYYGKNNRNGDDENPYALFEEAMEYAIQSVRLSEYDTDKDGYVDNVHIIFAGHGEEAGASSDAIWSHEMSFGRGYTFQDVLVDRYSCAPELRGNTGYGISRIGPHCHEIGHALGAMDYYDTNYEDNGYYQGTGVWDVMASGSWNEDGVVPADFNPYVKSENFGWVDVQELPEGIVSILPSSISPNNYYRINNNSDDYFLLENRTIDKWGAGLPGSGLLIFHIHPNLASSGNKINSTHPQKCYPVCASSNFAKPSSSSQSYGSINSAGCPYPGSSGKTIFANYSIPAAFAWNESGTNINIANIYKDFEEIITLNNQSSSSSVVDADFLFNEGFEESKDYSVSVDCGSTEWTQYSVPLNDVQKGIVLPHNGEGYLRFRPAKDSKSDQQSSVSFHTKEVIQETEALLSFYYYASSYRMEDDILGVCFRCDDQQWSDTVWINSNRTGWNNFILNIPAANQFSIKIFGRAVYGQAIYLDDIEIKSIQTTSMVPCVFDSSFDKGYTVYDFLGRKISYPKKGVYIINNDRGKQKKYLLK